MTLHTSSGKQEGTTTSISPQSVRHVIPRCRNSNQIVLGSWKSIIVKALVSLYMLVPTILLFRTCHPWYTYFNYLTVWGWTAIEIYFGYSLYLDLRKKLSSSPEDLSLVATHVAQALSEVAFAGNVVVTLFFWFVIYPREPWRKIRWEINMHGVGLIFMIFDYLYRFTGFRLRNHRFIVGFAIIYSVIHVVIVLTTGKAIYPGVDFKTSASFVILLSGLTTMVAFHKIIYLCHHWKRLKNEWKTVWGITQFFMIPRHDSVEYLLDEDTVPAANSEAPSSSSSSSSSSTNAAHFSEQERKGKSSNLPSDLPRNDPSKKCAEADSGSDNPPPLALATRGKPIRRSRKRSLFWNVSARLGSFTYRELLSVHPSEPARCHVTNKRRKKLE